MNTDSRSHPQSDICAFLRLLYRPGDVFEVRIPKCRANARSDFRSTYRGYYTSDQIDTAAADIAALDDTATAPGIYVTLNPVAPALLARANGRLESKASDTTKDTDVVRRAWVLVDLDPVRPAGVSSTDPELASALARAAVVKDTLRAERWPDPAEGMSGNGAHLIYKTDLPTDDGGLVARVLAALSARFSTDTVKIDTGVGNAARITKVLGTMARKGEHLVGVEGVEDRPHRRSQLLTVPADMKPVPRDLLEKVAVPAHQPPPPRTPPPSFQASSEKTFDEFPINAQGVREYLERHGVAIKGERTKGGATFLHLERCPVVADCVSESASDISVIVGDDGKIAYKNQHDRGQGLKWVDVREALEPGYKTWRGSQKRGPRAASPGCPDCPGPYEETPSGIFWNKAVGDVIAPVQLTYFTARIVAEVTRDDGAERRRVFTIEGRIGGREVSTFDVPAERFAGMNWPVEFMGVGAVVAAGMGAKDHARAAIQHLSKDVQKRTVYLHLGWRVIGGKHVFLHAGGAIGADGVVAGVEISPPPQLLGYRLPPPPDGEALQSAVRESILLLRFRPSALGVSQLASIYRASLGPCAFVMHIVGMTGALKSSALAAFLCHFGPSFDDKNLPGSWVSTDNALEAMAFAAKDVPFVIDDFAPNGTPSDIQRLHGKAERLFRGTANQQGRGRLRADTSFRETKCAQGLVISTGEDVPKGHSIRARAFIVEIQQGDIDPAALSNVQRLAAQGVYAGAMSGYIRWLACRIDSVQCALQERVRHLRDAAGGKHAHRRTPVIAAELQAGLEVFLQFAVECGAVSRPQADAHIAYAVQVLAELAAAQAAHQRDADPVNRFLGLIASAIASGDAHVCSAATRIKAPEDVVPVSPETWGWRPQDIGSGVSSRTVWKPSGSGIGWTDGDNLYLDLDAALRVANRMGVESPVGLPARTLAKRIDERGLLVRRESRDHLTVKVWLHGTRRRALHTRAVLLGGPGQPGHEADEPLPETENPDCAPIPCPDSEAGDEPSGAEDRGTIPGHGPETSPTVGVAGCAPIAPVRADGGSSGVNAPRCHAPGPPGTCYGCGHRRWYSRVGLHDWNCGGCHPAAGDPRFIIYWHGNEARA